MNTILGAVRRLYAFALALWPRSFRERYGAEMQATFEALSDDAAARGPGALLLMTARESVNLARTSRDARTVASDFRPTHGSAPTSVVEAAPTKETDRDRLVARPAIRHSSAPATTGIRGRGHRHARARHRREYRGVHGDQRRPAAAAAVCGSRSTRHAAERPQRPALGGLLAAELSSTSQPSPACSPARRRSSRRPRTSRDSAIRNGSKAPTSLDVLPGARRRASARPRVRRGRSQTERPGCRDQRRLVAAAVRRAIRHRQPDGDAGRQAVYRHRGRPAGGRHSAQRRILAAAGVFARRHRAAGTGRAIHLRGGAT